jgi:hypothetical protein
MKKIRGDEPIGVIIHIYMEISQGNSQCSYLYHKQAKMSCFLFSFFFFFHLQKSENKSCPEGRAGSNGRGEVLGYG